MGARRCLVLGSTGFLGKNLCRALLANGDQVRAYAISGCKLKSLRNEYPSIDTVQGDFEHENRYDEMLSDVDVAFHLVSRTNPANRDMLLEFTSNVLPTVRFLDACVRSRRKLHLIFFSSGGTVYGIPRCVPINEEHRTEPISAYGIHKLSVEKCIEYYGRTYGLSYTILRISNPYGRWQDPAAQQGAIAVFLARALRGEPIEIWGDGSAVRDYVYVDDVMDACMKVTYYRGGERTFNIGSGTGHSLNDVMRLVEHELGVHLQVERRSGRVQDVPANVLDCSLAGRELGWQVKVGLVQGIHAMANMWDSKRKIYGLRRAQ